MVRVVRKIFELKQASRPQDAAALVSWLSGSSNVAAGIKNMVKSAGYGGLVIVIDEAETILRMRGDVRGKSLNAIRQIVDMASGNPGLLWVFTGTFTFFDDRQGVKGVEARYARIRYEELNGVPSLRQPQLALEPFDRDRLSKVALKLRSMHPDLDPEEAERRLPRELIEQLLDKVTEGYHGDVGVVPRQFLRTLVNLLDLLADDENENAHDRLGFVPAALTEEEEAVIAGRKLDGKNAVVLAPTAGGKTEASIFPILAGLLESPPVGVGAIYVAPITALLNNQEVRLGEYTEMVGLRRFVWHGDAAATKKQAFVSEPAELPDDDARVARGHADVGARPRAAALR